MGNGNANSLSRANQTTFEIIDFNDVVNHIISCHVIDWMVFRNGPNRITRMNSNNFSRTIVEGRLSPESIEMSNYEPKKYEKHKAGGKEPCLTAACEEMEEGDEEQQSITRNAVGDCLRAAVPSIETL